MSDEQVTESQVVKDTKAFNEWYEKNIALLSVKAKDSGLNEKLSEVMRMAWRKCSEYKNKEAEKYLETIESLKSDISSQKKKNDELFLELQKVTNKLIQAEKNAKK